MKFESIEKIIFPTETVFEWEALISMYLVKLYKASEEVTWEYETVGLKSSPRNRHGESIDLLTE